MARAVLGLDGNADPFATLADLAVATGKGGGPQVSILLAQIQKSWSESDEARATLDAIAGLAIAAIEDLGKVAQISDVVNYLLPLSAQNTDRRITAGLVRFALDRADDVAAGSGDPAPVIKRRSRRVLLVATDSRVLDAGVAMGALVDKLLADATRAGQLLVLPARAVERLAPKWPDTDDGGHGLTRPADRALTRLAAQLSEHGAVSARGELHDRDLDAATALRLAVTGLTPGQDLSVDDLLATVRSRFPDLPDLPRRTRLDQLVADAELGLRWNDNRSRYEAPADPTYTTAGYSATMHTIGEARVPLAPGQLLSPAHATLAASCESHAFLVLGLPRTRRLGQAVSELETRYAAQPMDVTELVITVLREQADAAGVPWSTVTAADAKGTERDWQGITTLVRKGEPQIAAALTSAATTKDERPLLLTDAAPLARYGLMPVLAQLADITTPRARPVWLLLPLGNQAGPVLDGVDLQLSHSGQFLILDEQWFTTPSVLEGEPA